YLAHLAVLAFFSSNAPPPTATYTLSLHDALPISLFGVALAQSGPAQSENLESRFWEQLYPEGGETFYCKKPFTQKTMLLTESHIYSTSWIREHLRCGTSKQCREESEEYQRITADLHNIVPADTRIDLERSTA